MGDTKLIVYTALVVVCLALGIAGVATTLYENKDQDASKISFSLWEACVHIKSTDTKGCVKLDSFVTCDAHAGRIKAARAFGIIAIIAIFVQLVLAVIELRTPTTIPRGALIAFSAGIFVFTIITWATAASVYTGKFCGQTESVAETKQYKLGGVIPLWVVVSFLCLFNLILSFLYQAQATSGTGQSASTEPAGKVNPTMSAAPSSINTTGPTNPTGPAPTYDFTTTTTTTTTAPTMLTTTAPMGGYPAQQPAPSAFGTGAPFGGPATFDNTPSTAAPYGAPAPAAAPYGGPAASAPL